MCFCELQVERTGTTKVRVAALPAASDEVQVTVVEPIGNSEPEAGVHVTATTPFTASTEVTVYVTTRPFAAVAF